MNILILSVHPENDNRISKHISTLLKKGYKIKYINSSFSKNTVNTMATIDNFLYKHINIECHPKKNPINYIVILLFFVFQMLKNPEYKHIHIHDNFLLPITFFAKLLNRRVYYDKHEYYENASKFHYLYEKIFSKFIDKYILVTEGQINFISKKEYVIIPNYQSKAFYSSIVEDEDRMITMTYIGSLSPTDRDIDSMLYVFKKLSTTNIRIIFGGRNLPNNYRSSIEYLKEINKNFVFLENLDYKEVAYYTKNSDLCLLLLSKDIPIDISNNKVYENLICKNLLIAYEGVRFIDYIASKGIFKTFSRNDNDRIVDYILDIVNNPDKLSILKSKSSMISDMYTWESIEDRYYNLYN